MSTDALPGTYVSPVLRSAPSEDVGAPEPPSLHPVLSDLPRVVLGGSLVHLVTQEMAIRLIAERALRQDVAMAVVSANLDHVHHFGTGGRWHGVLESAEKAGELELLTLLDGMPLVRHAETLTGRSWPRLAGSDLIAPILEEAERVGASVGFLGGTEEILREVRRQLAVRHPLLRVVGTWAPARAVVADAAASALLAEEIRRVQPDILVVGMGKPRQELWIAEHGPATGAKVLLAFGAVVDFLAGRVSRAPAWMARSGLEWSYRLALEPRRLARRYLIDGPAAYLRLHQQSREVSDDLPPHEDVDITIILSPGSPPSEVAPAGLRSVSGDDLTTRVIVAEDDPRRALDQIGPTRAVLLMCPQLRPDPEAISLLWKRLWKNGVGAVAPRTASHDGVTEPTLRFSRTVSRVLGDWLLGPRMPSRPSWSTLTDRDPEAYQHAHPVDDVEPGCILMRAEVAERYAASSTRRDPRGVALTARETGWSVWYEPTAVVRRAPAAATRRLGS